MTLQEVPLHTPARILVLHQEPHMKRRLMDLGFTCGSVVIPVLESPSKGMRAYLVKGCKIALRTREETGIEIEEEEESCVV